MVSMHHRTLFMLILLVSIIKGVFYSLVMSKDEVMLFAISNIELNSK